MKVRSCFGTSDTGATGTKPQANSRGHGAEWTGEEPTSAIASGRYSAHPVGSQKIWTKRPVNSVFAGFRRFPPVSAAFAQGGVEGLRHPLGAQKSPKSRIISRRSASSRLFEGGEEWGEKFGGRALNSASRSNLGEPGFNDFLTKALPILIIVSGIPASWYCREMKE